MKKIRNIITFFLIALSVIGTVPVTAVAATTAKWSLSNSGVLTVSGTGATGNIRNDVFDRYSTVSGVKEVIIEEGITEISQQAFYMLYNVTKVTLPEGLLTIGKGAFRTSEKLEYINIPSTVTSIGEEAFSGCILISEIDLPDSIKAVEERTFYGCENLSVTLPSALQTIGEYAFYNVLKAADSHDTATLTVPETVTSIGRYAFYGADIEKLVLNNGVTRIEEATFKGNKIKEIEFPESLTYIGANAFESNKFTTLTLPAGVTEVGNKAFAYCSDMTEVTIPGSVTKLGTQVFYSCSKLEKVTIGSGMTTLDTGVFYGCYDLAEIEIPASVTTITGTFSANDVIISGELMSAAQTYANKYGYLFRNSATGQISIASGTCGTNNSVVWTLDENYVLTVSGSGEVPEVSYGKGWYNYKSQITGVVVKSGITSIGDYAFRDYEALKSVTVENGVTEIGYRAFYSCGALEKAVLPASLTKVDTYVFYDCDAMVELEIPFAASTPSASTHYLSYWFGGSSYSSNNGTSYIPSTLKSVSISDGVKKIGSRMFYYCKNLSKIEIPASVTTIESYAFYYCQNLSYMIFNGNPPTLSGSSQFSGVPSSMLVLYTDENAGFSSKWQGFTTRYINSTDNFYPEFEWQISGGNIIINKYIGDGTVVTVPEKILGIPVTKIADAAFAENTAITEVTLPSGITEIGDGIFEDCDNIEKITVPFMAKTLSASTQYLAYLFGESSYNYYYNIPYSLKSVVINGNITKISPNAFYFCDIEEVVLPESITEIGKNAFYYCDKLKNITIPQKVTRIDDSAFYRCSALTEIHIPKNVAYIGKSVVFGSKMKNITVDSGNAYYKDIDGVLFTKDGTVLKQYPSAKSGAYTVPEGVTEIAESAFVTSTATEVTLPESLIKIGESAFASASAITEINIPEKVNTIGNNSFYNTQLLKNITVAAENKYFSSENGVLYNKEKTTIVRYPDGKEGDSFELPESVKTIGDGAFRGAEIKSIDISGITAIENYAFDGCKLLTEIIIPEGITTIPNYAFTGCTTLATVTVPESVTTIGQSAFADCSALKTVKYPGTSQQWNSITISSSNNPIKNAAKIFLCEILYDTAGGSPAIDGVSVYTGDTVRVSDIVPHKAGNTFMGWSTSAGGEVQYQPGDTFVAADSVTLYAIWQAETYEVVYNANGGDNAPANQIKTYDVDLTLSTEIPVKEGYIFKGWSFGDRVYQPGDTYSENAPLSLTAIWEVETYSVSYDANGGENTPAEQIKTYGEDLTLSAEIPTKAGYTFMGWNSADGVYWPGDVYSGNKALNLVAIWDIQTYVISYNANGGKNAPEKQVKTYGVDLTLSTKIPTKEGYNFAGWSCGDEVYQPGDVYSGNKALELVAMWDIQTYPVTYNANGGENAPARQMKMYGVNLPLSTKIPTREGYNFVGWSSADGEYQPGDVYSGNKAIELVAMWDIKTYTVKYSANGGENAPATQIKTHDMSLTLSTEIPTREGYNFIGWATSSNGNVQYRPGDVYSENSEMALYAVWVLKRYIVEYENGNGIYVISEEKYHGIDFKLPEEAPVKTGYIFKGWATSEDGDAEYQLGDIYTKNEDVVFYAVWEMITYTVTYDANGGINAPAAHTVQYGHFGIIPSEIPTREGFVFLGWAESADATEARYTAGNLWGPPMEDTTFYAVWREIAGTPEIKAENVRGGKKITITAKNNGAQIYYTLDGSAPDKNSLLYNGSITVKAGCTVKAIAIQEGFENSAVASMDITVESAGSVNANPETGAVIKAGTSVTLTAEIPEAEIYYTTNGKNPLENGIRYTGSVTIMSDTVLKAVAVCNGYADSSIFEFSYTIATAQRPVISISDVVGGKQFTISAQSGATVYYTIDGSVPTEENTVYGSAVKITVPGTYHIRAVAVVDGYKISDISETVECKVERAGKPVSSADSGEVAIGEYIFLESPTEGAVIYYTTNGKTPTTSSTPYMSEIMIEDDTVIKAIAVKRGMANSAVATFTYTVGKAQVPELDYSGDGTVSVGTVLKIKAGTYGNVYYTLDGSIPTESDNLYTSGIIINDDCTVKLINIEDGKKSSEISTYIFKVKQTETPQITTENVLGGKKVKITCKTAGVKIYYTTDGSIPNENSLVYNGMFELTETKTITAIAVSEGYKPSSVTSTVVAVEKAQTPVIVIASEVVEEGTAFALEAEGMKIYYTLDGSNPKEYGILYETPVVLTKDVIIKAIAADYGTAYGEIAEKAVTVTKKAVIRLVEEKTGNESEIKLRAEISGNRGISSAFIKLKYPVKMLTSEKAEQTDITSNGSFVTFEDETGLNVLWVNTENITDDGVLFTVTLKKNGAVNAEIRLTCVDVINESYEDVYFDDTEATIVVSGGEDYGLSISDSIIRIESGSLKSTADVTVINNSGKEKEAVLIFALYDGDKLIACQKVPKTLAKGNNIIPVSVTEKFSGTAKNITAKLMLWESAESAMSLCHPQGFNAE